MLREGVLREDVLREGVLREDAEERVLSCGDGRGLVGVFVLEVDGDFGLRTISRVAFDPLAKTETV